MCQYFWHKTKRQHQQEKLFRKLPKVKPQKTRQALRCLNTERNLSCFTHPTENVSLSMGSFSRVGPGGKRLCATESLIKSESVVSELRTVSAYQIIMVNKLWAYLDHIYISSPSSSTLLALLSLFMILFVSQCLANFALGCNFGSQENSPLLHNLVSRATVVLQLQSERCREESISRVMQCKWSAH